MPIEFDWSVVEKVGLAGVCLAVIFFGYKLFELFMQRWKESTEVVHKNTEAFTQLSIVFEKSHQREVEFQKEALELLKANHAYSKDTNERIRDIQIKI